MVWLLIGLYGLILIMELPQLFRKRWYLETGFFMVLLAIGIWMSISCYNDGQITEFFEYINTYLLEDLDG
ncbi:Uncharacterized [Syntrophomonas zehnderi OL-4]|uniref:Uncharacterized n=1 Tax=Syntrophomonas zehnderi OL-4 TaxID=690567 RepID=A0A0E4C7S6_9FIRM|nr:hypothetical protein [Syntrophomonas zehnderi]CFX10331.1 Uncharacterized [Syntrophomonas zehnderi OL-4]